MKKSYFIFLIAFCTAFLVPCRGMADEYTLRDLYQQALANSEKIKYAKENLYIAQMTKNKAWAVLMPRLTAYGTYNHFSEEKYKTTVTPCLLCPP